MTLVTTFKFKDLDHEKRGKKTLKTARVAQKPIVGDVWAMYNSGNCACL